MDAIFAQLIIAGITSGSIYGLAALAFTLTFSSTKVANFGQGEFVMLGAMLSVTFASTLHLPVVVTILIIAAVVGLVGMVMERVLINPLNKRGANVMAFVIGTLAFGLMIRDSSALIWGKTYEFVPTIFGEVPIRFGGLTVMPQNLLIVVATLFIVLCLWIFLERTILGKAIRAAAFNRTAANLIGIDVTRLVLITIMISSAIAGVAGYFFAPIVSANAYMGMDYSIKSFLASIIGGIGNPFVAMAGGILIGIIEQLSSAYISSDYYNVITFLIMLAVLMFRPNGIFGSKDF